jgi:hypothetical protein
MMALQEFRVHHDSQTGIVYPLLELVFFDFITS